MTRVTFTFIEFRHERQCHAFLGGNLLRTILIDTVVIAGA